MPNKTELVVYDLVNNRVESKFTIGKEIALTMTLLQDNSIALILANGRTLEYSASIDIWNITSGKLMRSYDIAKLTGFYAGYRDYIFSKLQNGAVFLYIGWPSFKICSLNLIDGKLIYITDDTFTVRYDNEVEAISAISDTKLVLKIVKSQTFDNFIKIINPKTGENISEIKGTSKLLDFILQTGLSILPDGLIATGRGNTGILDVFDADKSQLKMSINVGFSWISGIDVLPDGSLVILNSSNEIRILN